MVETHGGGRHYVPEDTETAAKGVNASQPLFRSLEDPDNLIILVPAKDSDLLPLSLNRGNLTKVQDVLGGKVASGDSSPMATLFRDRTIAQNDVADIKLYDPLVPGDVSTSQHPTPETLAALAKAMLADSDSVSKIPAAYTYFGQFLAHDMSYMKLKDTSEGKYWTNKKAFHGLHFDSLFGTVDEPGPPSSEWICHAGATLGQASPAAFGHAAAFDLPRAAGNGDPQCRDPRADSNLALAQMHVLLVRFHQKMAKLTGLDDNDAKLETRRHLQAVVLTDYLPRIVPTEIFQDVMQNGRRIVATDESKPFLIPLEFSTAIFRFGHSMIRRLYSDWNITWPEGSSLVPNEALLSHLLGYTQKGTRLRYKDENGEERRDRLPYNWAQMWRHMVDVETPYLRSRQIFAKQINATISKDLANIPFANFPDVSNDGSQRPHFNLGFHTMQRAKRFQLPSGQDLASHFNQPITVNMANFFKSHHRFEAFAKDKLLCEQTPLWFYTLAEAEACGEGKLGPLGGRVVMETIHAALETSGLILKRSPNERYEITFTRAVRKEHGHEREFSIRDVVALAYDGI